MTKPNAPEAESKNAASQPAVEIELKLLATTEAIARLSHPNFLEQLGVVDIGTKELVSTYYDTPDCRLKKHKAALRVRRTANGYLQTFKMVHRRGGGVEHRGEWEHPVEDFNPVLNVIPLNARKSLSLTRRSQLVPVFSTVFTRRCAEFNTSKLLGTPGVIEIAFDDGRIEGPTGKRLELAEIELELKSGAPALLYLFASILHAHEPLRIGYRSKAERGYALSVDESPHFEKAKRVALTPSMTVNHAIVTIFNSCLQQMTLNEDAALDAHPPEGIHQLRVGHRRFRSALALFRRWLPSYARKWFRRESRWISARLALARDLDIVCDELLTPLETFELYRDELKQLRNALNSTRMRARKRVRATLVHSRYTRFILHLGSFLEMAAWSRCDEPISQYAATLLDEKVEPIVSITTPIEQMTIEEKHATRIALKKMRYTMDFLRTLYPKSTVNRYLNDLASLQDYLGNYNDVAVAEAAIARTCRDWPKKKRNALLIGGGILVGFHLQRLSEQKESIQRIWDSLRNETPFWRKNLI